MKRKIWNVMLAVLVAIAIICLGFSIAAFASAPKAGADGTSAYETWLENGHKGTKQDFLNWLKGDKGESGTNGNDGTDGVDGESAFEIWKDKYGDVNSTEDDFLNWLKGEKGENGADGKDGQNGQDGENGKDGNDGADGKSAFEIWKDKYGDESSTEDDFLNWLKGEKGDKGEKGYSFTAA